MTSIELEAIRHRTPGEGPRSQLMKDTVTLLGEVDRLRYMLRTINRLTDLAVAPETRLAEIRGMVDQL